MKFVTKFLLLVATALSMLASPASASPVFQLGFALDASGSVSTTNYNLLRSGLSNAIAALPTDGSVEITIVSYSSGVATVVAPTVLTAATLTTIQTAISTHSKSSGGTNTAAAITSLTALMTGSSTFLDPQVKSIINLATDGVPNSQSAAETAAVAAFDAGIDALSIEAIGSGVSSTTALNNMAAIAFPDTVTILPVNSTDIPNPLDGSFVVPVSDFASLEPILKAKVIASVTPTNPVPEPATALLVALGAIGLSMRRRNA